MPCAMPRLGETIAQGIGGRVGKKAAEGLGE
jgi:hypothetical protein